MEELLKNFFEEINPLIRQLRIKENIKQDDISYKLEVLSIKREIREKTQSFIEDYKTKCMNEIERLKNEIVNCEDSKNKNILEKELSNSEKELEAFNEHMGDIDFSNSNYIFFLQALIGRMEEQTMSRMNDGIIYVNGKKVKDMNTFTVEDALKIGKEEKFEIVRSPDFPTSEEEKEQCEKLNSIFEKLEEDFKGCLSPEYYYLKQKIYDTPEGRKVLFQGPLTLETMYKVIIRNLKEGSPERKNNENMLNAVIARKEEIEQSKNKQHQEKEEKFEIVRSPDFPTSEEEKEQCEKLNSIFEKLEEDFKGCLSPEYYYLKQKIYDTPEGRKVLFQGPLTLETMYKVIIRNLKEGSPERKNNENMLNAVIARREELEQSKNKQPQEKEIQANNCLVVEVKEKPSIFDNIKKVGKSMKNWFVTKLSGNNKKKMLEGNISKRDEKSAYFETLKADVDATIIPYPETREGKQPEEREVI